MLALLTKYLVQYKRVSIPHIGSFELIQQTPELQVADKLITAPGYTTVYLNTDQVSEHQVHFIAQGEKGEKERLEKSLSVFGENLKRHIHKSPFQWKGFGELRYSSSQLVFIPQSLQLEALNDVRAKKVMRENAQHSMLVGDQQMTSQEVTDALNKPEEIQKPLYMVIGWIILIVAIIVIIVMLFIGKFNPTAAGLN